MKLTPSTILVTGSAKRIGRSIVEHFAQLGFQVIIHYNQSEPEATQLQKQLGTGKLVQGCLDEPKEIDELFHRALDCYGKIDVLVNSASVFAYDNIKTMSRDNWDYHLNTNLWAPMRLSQLMAEHCQDNGNIINIIDQRVQNLTPHFMSYTVSKAGLWTITQTLAMALAPKIRVNAIAPGPVIRNEMQSQKDFERQWQQTPLQRSVEPEEIARMIESILQCPSMTGQLITLDSGQHMGWSFPQRSSKADMG